MIFVMNFISVLPNIIIIIIIVFILKKSPDTAHLCLYMIIGY